MGVVGVGSKKEGEWAEISFGVLVQSPLPPSPRQERMATPTTQFMHTWLTDRKARTIKKERLERREKRDMDCGTKAVYCYMLAYLLTVGAFAQFCTSPLLAEASGALMIFTRAESLIRSPPFEP